VSVVIRLPLVTAAATALTGLSSCDRASPSPRTAGTRADRVAGQGGVGDMYYNGVDGENDTPPEWASNKSAT
jgi:hypothetical protein